jgi:hypothetical protein
MSVRIAEDAMPENKKKTFIVATEEYSGMGYGGPIRLSKHEAEDLIEVLHELFGTADPFNDLGRFDDMNGDGMESYTISELRPDGVLEPKFPSFLVEEWKEKCNASNT